MTNIGVSTSEFKYVRTLVLWRERIDNSAHSPSCALDHTVSDILGCLHTTLRNVFRSSHRSGLSRANGNGEG